MSRLLGLFVASCIVLAAIPAESAVAQPATDDGKSASPAATKVMELANAFRDKGVRTVIVYFEFDRSTLGEKPRPIIEIDGVLDKSNYLIRYNGHKDEFDIANALAAEALAEGWGSCLIVVNDGTLTMERGPGAGSINDFPKRSYEIVRRTAAHYNGFERDAP